MISVNVQHRLNNTYELHTVLVLPSWQPIAHPFTNYYSYLFWHSSHYHPSSHWRSTMAQWHTLDSLLPIDSSTFLKTYVFGFSLKLVDSVVYVHAKMTRNDSWHASINEASMTRKLVTMSVDNGRPWYIIQRCCIYFYSFIGCNMALTFFYTDSFGITAFEMLL